ncbi:MAG: amidohydrolase family protein [bacterium]|nr:amidohydrolase family protein [Acidimicrobiia bacterium]MCY4650777.1 amidohydrolase family protein [bacterium]
MWLTDARVVDVVRGQIRDGVSVEISGGRIGAIQKQPGAGERRSLGGRYLVPGLISVHTHLSVVYPFSAHDENENPGLTVLRAYQRAQDALHAGVTTIRCVHELNRADLLLAEAARAGWADVPRIVGAGRALSTTDGHGDGGIGCAIVDGPEAFREAALAELDAGCSHIKVFITGGIAKLGETFDHPEMSLEEMRATVDAASERDTYVVAHAASSLAINRALDAGIRSFEHAYDLDEDTARRMAAEGVFLTPTLCVTRSQEWMKWKGFEDFQIETSLQVGPMHLASIRRAVAAGVTMVNGTDYPPGDPIGGTSVAVHEMNLMEGAGLHPKLALAGATSNAARLLGLESEIGTVEQGKMADLVAVDENPLADVSAMRDISFVMQSGRVVRDDRPAP